MTLVEEIALQQAETCRKIYERKKRLTPKLWAQGLNSMILAEPIEEQVGRETTDQTRATLLIAMGLRVEALAIGRSDEGIIRAFTESGLKSGDLIARRDEDPMIRAAVIVEAIAIGGEEEITVVSTHGLDDFGRTTWDVGTSRNLEAYSLVPLRVARDMITNGLPDYWRDETALRQFADQMRWHLEEFPQATSW